MGQRGRPGRRPEVVQFEIAKQLASLRATRSPASDAGVAKRERGSRATSRRPKEARGLARDGAREQEKLTKAIDALVVKGRQMEAEKAYIIGDDPTRGFLVAQPALWPAPSLRACQPEAGRDDDVEEGERSKTASSWCDKQEKVAHAHGEFDLYFAGMTPPPGNTHYMTGGSTGTEGCEKSSRRSSPRESIGIVVEAAQKIPMTLELDEEYRIQDGHVQGAGGRSKDLRMLCRNDHTDSFSCIAQVAEEPCTTGRDSTAGRAPSGSFRRWQSTTTCCTATSKNVVQDDCKERLRDCVEDQFQRPSRPDSPPTTSSPTSSTTCSRPTA